MDNFPDGYGAVDNSETRFVVVTNLDDSIDDYDLREKFEKFGHVPSIELPFQTDSKYGRCAKLQFALAPAARAACSKLGGKNWRGKRIQAYTYDRWLRVSKEQAATVEEVPVKNKIFVGGLGQQISVHTMRRYFQGFGPIDFRQSKIITDRGGHSKGFGFVVFESEDVAQLVLRQTLHWIEGKQVNVGPVHEKKIVHIPVEPEPKPQPQQSKANPSRSRSYDRSTSHSSSSSSTSKSTSRSRSRSNSAQRDEEVEEKVEPVLGVPSEEPEVQEEEDLESYQEQVALKLQKMQQAESNEKTLEQRRKERRARWKRKAKPAS